MSEFNPHGWKCPTCNRVWSPGIRYCEECEKTESKEKSNKQLLQEFEQSEEDKRLFLDE